MDWNLFNPVEVELLVGEVADSDDPDFHKYLLTDEYELYVGKPGSLERLKKQHCESSDPLPLIVPPELRP